MPIAVDPYIEEDESDLREIKTSCFCTYDTFKKIDVANAFKKIAEHHTQPSECYH